jgi:hypothetical protein
MAFSHMLHLSNIVMNDDTCVMMWLKLGDGRQVMVGMHKDGRQLGIARLVEWIPSTLLYFFKRKTQNEFN